MFKNKEEMFEFIKAQGEKIDSLENTIKEMSITPPTPTTDPKGDDDDEEKDNHEPEDTPDEIDAFLDITGD